MISRDNNLLNIHGSAILPEFPDRAITAGLEADDTRNAREEQD